MLGKLTALAGLAAMVGCYDGSIEVNFDVPEEVLEGTMVAIEDVSLVVYAEAAAPLSCDDLSFDDIPFEVLETTAVFSATTRLGEAIPVRDVPRKGKKLFFAEAILDTGASLFAGCAEHGEITGPTVIDIEPFVRTNLTFESRLVDRDADGGEINIVDASVVGLNALPRAGEPVKWRLRGADADGLFESSGTETTNMNGRARIIIPDSQRPPSWGPVELEVRSRWAQSQAPPLDDFLDPPALEGAVTGDARTGAVARGNDVLEVGRLTPGSDPSIVILAAEAPAGGAEPTNAHVFSLGNGRLIKDDVVFLGDNSDGQGALTIGKLRFNEQDRLVSVWRRGSGQLVWTEIGTGVEKPSPYSDLPLKLGAAGGCKGMVESILFAQVQGNLFEIEAATLNGMTSDETPPPLTDLGSTPELIEVGCVRDTLNIYRTLFVFDPSEMQEGILSPFAPALRIFDPENRIVFRGGVDTGATTAWIGDFSETAEGAMLLGEVTLEGPATGRYLLQSTLPSQSVAADFQGLDPTPSVVLATAEGDINGDTETDVISLLATGINATGVDVVVHVSMAIAGSPLRLRGTMTDPIATLSPRLRVIDLNGDGVDDIVLGSADTVRVFLMGPR